MTLSDALHSDLVRWMLDYITKTVVPFVTLLAGYRIKSWEFKRSEISVRAKDLVEEINLLVSCNCAHWSSPYDPKNNTPLHVQQEGEMRGRNHVVASLVDEYCNLCPSTERAELEGLVQALRQATTGGVFASGTKRPAQPNMIQSGFVAGHKLSARVRKTERETRLRVFGPR